jgi:flagellar hook-associated protein 3 FlgL
MRITSGMSQRHVLSDLRRVQERLAAAQDQVSSGKRVEKPSDDPLAAERATRLRADLGSTAAYRTSVDESTSWLDATDSALDSLTQIVQHVRELTVQANNGATSDAGRQAIQAQIDQLTEQAKTTLNGAYDGRYLFSGTATNQPPYTAATGNAYQGDTGAVVRQIGPGVSVQVNVTADDVLGSVTWLQSGDLSQIDAGLDNIVAKRSQIGAITNRVTAAGQRLDDLSDITTNLLSNTEDADLPQALIDLSSQQTALQSALRGGATLIQQSLMDFLQ